MAEETVEETFGRPVVHRERDGEGVCVGFDTALVELTLVSAPGGQKRIHAVVRQLPPGWGFSYIVEGDNLRARSSGGTAAQTIPEG